MSDAVKVCKVHGDLKLDQVYQERMGVSFRFKCKQCVHDAHVRNLDKRRAYSKEYEQTKRKRPKTDAQLEKERTYAREWRRKNASLVNARVAAAHEKDPEKYREYDRKWRAENLAKARLQDVAKKKGLGYDEYVQMFAIQNGLCAICQQPETRKSRTKGQTARLCVDHNHKTGKVRKLLCHNCNQVVGHSKESEERLFAVIEYLRLHNSRADK